MNIAVRPGRRLLCPVINPQTHGANPIRADRIVEERRVQVATTHRGVLPPVAGRLLE